MLSADPPNDIPEPDVSNPGLPPLIIDYLVRACTDPDVSEYATWPAELLFRFDQIPDDGQLFDFLCQGLTAALSLWLEDREEAGAGHDADGLDQVWSSLPAAYRRLYDIMVWMEEWSRTDPLAELSSLDTDEVLRICASFRHFGLDRMAGAFESAVRTCMATATGSLGEEDRTAAVTRAFEAHLPYEMPSLQGQFAQAVRQNYRAFLQPG